MNSHDTAKAFARAFAVSGKAALAACRFYAHDMEIAITTGTEIPHVAEITIPGIFVTVSFEGLANSSTIGKGTLKIDLESQSDDDSAVIHSAREKAIREIMGNAGALADAFTEIGTVALCGRPACIANEPGTEGRAFKTPITYRIGVQELATLTTPTPTPSPTPSPVLTDAFLSPDGSQFFAGANGSQYFAQNLP